MIHILTGNKLVQDYLEVGKCLGNIHLESTVRKVHMMAYKVHRVRMVHRGHMVRMLVCK